MGVPDLRIKAGVKPMRNRAFIAALGRVAERQRVGDTTLKHGVCQGWEVSECGAETLIDYVNEYFELLTLEELESIAEKLGVIE